MKSPLASQNTSYQLSYTVSTRFGGLIGSVFETVFLFYYLASGYPLQAVGLQVLAVLFSLSGLVLVQFLQRPRLAAHLVTLGLYTSLFGPGVFTGGIDSSAMVWLVFVPVVAALMAGERASLGWGAFTMLSLAAIFILNRVSMIDLTVRPTESVDLGGSNVITLTANQGTGTPPIYPLTNINGGTTNYKGMLIYSQSTSPYTMNGSGITNYTGTVYVPHAECTVNGNNTGATYDSQMICDTITVSGNGNLTFTNNSNHYTPLGETLSLMH